MHIVRGSGQLDHGTSHYDELLDSHLHAQAGFMQSSSTWASGATCCPAKAVAHTTSFPLDAPPDSAFASMIGRYGVLVD